MNNKLLCTALIAVSFTTFAQVGIGTNDPKGTLDIVGDAATVTSLDGIIVPRITGDQLRHKIYTADQTAAIVYVTAADSAPAGQTVNVTAVGHYQYDGTAWQKFAIGGTSKFVDGTNSENAVFNGGKVGIGTTNPTKPLSIVSSTGAAVLSVSGYGSSPFHRGLVTLSSARGSEASPTKTLSDDYLGTIQFTGHNGTTFNGRSASITSVASGDFTGASQGANMVFSTAKEGTIHEVERVRISNDGNVGIGTVAPSSTLHLNGGDITVQTMEYNDVAGGYGEILFKDESKSKWGVDVLSDSDVNNSAKNRFQIFQYTDQTDNTVNQLRMAIDDAGNVGFGTGVPSSKLHLNGGDITVQTMEYSDVAGGYGEILFKDESTSKWGVSVLSNSNVSSEAKNRFQILQYTDQTDNTVNQLRIAIDDAGDVGIGTGVPSAKLDVNGAIKIGTSSGTPTAGTIQYGDPNGTGMGFYGYTGSSWVQLN